eukprot:gene8575-34010_t
MDWARFTCYFASSPAFSLALLRCTGGLGPLHKLFRILSCILTGTPALHWYFPSLNSSSTLAVLPPVVVGPRSRVPMTYSLCPKCSSCPMTHATLAGFP